MNPTHPFTFLTWQQSLITLGWSYALFTTPHHDTHNNHTPTLDVPPTPGISSPEIFITAATRIYSSDLRPLNYHHPLYPFLIIIPKLTYHTIPCYIRNLGPLHQCSYQLVGASFLSTTTNIFQEGGSTLDDSPPQ